MAKVFNRYLTKVYICMVGIILKRFSTSHVMREIQIKTGRYHNIHITVAKIQNRQYHVLTRGWNNRIFHSLLMEMQNKMVTLEDTYSKSWTQPYIMWGEKKLVKMAWSVSLTPWPLAFMPCFVSKDYITAELIYSTAQVCHEVLIWSRDTLCCRDVWAPPIK